MKLNVTIQIFIKKNPDIAKSSSKEWKHALKYGTAVQVRLHRGTLLLIPQSLEKEKMRLLGSGSCEK